MCVCVWDTGQGTLLVNLDFDVLQPILRLFSAFHAEITNGALHEAQMRHICDNWQFLRIPFVASDENMMTILALCNLVGYYTGCITRLHVSIGSRHSDQRHVCARRLRRCDSDIFEIINNIMSEAKSAFLFSATSMSKRFPYSPK